ncbi:hypothetical protein, partial [uncultured Sulfurimonas sp.]|uniref:hypothetical protein n=1 Tax=uncultured Sulfurimonas sp. TaxID=291845 RepID=UPI0032B289AB
WVSELKCHRCPICSVFCKYDLEPLKLDRKKLYGSSEKIALDNEDNICNAVSLYPELSMLIPKGGTALGSVNIQGNWIEKSDMKYINEDGTDATIVSSSFDAPIELSSTVSIEHYLEHNITSIYSLQGEENHPDFVKAIQEQKEVYTFEFNYRADYEGDPAFVLENDGEVFVLVGKKIEFEFIGLNDEGTLDSEDEEIEEEVEDDFDFSMM